jgi:molecular chaperone DnaJ
VSKRDLYEVLGVARSASGDDLKKAYRKRALECHPDKNPGNKQAEEQFKELSQAYSVLSDPDSRKRYDQFGHAAFEQGGGGGGFQGFEGTGFEDIFGDIFENFFGGQQRGGGGRTKGRSGRDLRYDLEISFEESAFGGERSIELTRRMACSDCSGSGAEGGSKPETCSQCGGAGQVRVQQGFFTMARTCSRCQGSGSVIKNPCIHCQGSGLKGKSQTLSIKIPPGIDEGQRLKLRGEGEAGMGGGPPGDLYVQIAIKKHPLFAREEGEVFCRVPISYTQAVLGGEIEAPTLDGPYKLKIPPGTPSGKIFKVKGKGIVAIGSSRRGDQHTEVYVEVPKKISDEKKVLLEKLAELDAIEPHEESKSFFDKVKEIFA